MISGIINVYKEKGYTSHDVVARMRGILHQKKIGHTGTLDPEAEGVLPVCLGTGTKLCDMLTDSGKVYQAVLLLGQTTDTQDTTGRVLSTVPVKTDEESVRSCIQSFVGSYDQIPPMYSALKVQGKKLYELARAGIEVERKPRRVEIYHIEIQNISLPEVTFTVSCSKGTYIRTLCHDIGDCLGCGGCMASLCRIRVDEFCISDSLRLDQIEKLRDEGTLDRYIMPVDAAFGSVPKAVVRPEALKLLMNGNPLKISQLCGEELQFADRLRVYDTQHRFCGLYRMDAHRNLFVPEKMFLGTSDVR